MVKLKNESVTSSYRQKLKTADETTRLTNIANLETFPYPMQSKSSAKAKPIKRRLEKAADTKIPKIAASEKRRKQVRKTDSRIAKTLHQLLFSGLLLILGGMYCPCFAKDFGSSPTSTIGSFVAKLLKQLNCGGVVGNGKIVAKTYDFTDQPFDTINISGAFEVIINVSDLHNKATATVNIDNNLLPYLKFVVKEKVLSIYSDKNIKSWGARKISMNIKNLRSFMTDGSSESTLNSLKSDSFYLQLKGSGTVNLFGNTGLLSVHSSGSGTINLHGTANILSIQSHGSGKIDTLSLDTEKVEINLDGSGKIFTRAAQKLYINLQGSGIVEYLGTPKDGVEKSIMGSGEVIAKTIEKRSKK